jgi:hypothetical protein
MLGILFRYDIIHPGTLTAIVFYLGRNHALFLSLCVFRYILYIFAV